jgi:DNA-binding NarL/FixJ family response regulator
MSDRIPVFVYAADPISQAGVSSQLRYRPEVRLVDAVEMDSSTVAVVVADEVDEQTITAIRSIRRNGCRYVVVVVTRVNNERLLAAIEAGSCGLLRWAEAVPERLVAVIEAAAAGHGTVPPDLLGRLIDQVGNLQRQALSPRGLTFTGFTERELKVLRLLADGHDTAEIANDLAYSERTVKNIIHDITTRLQLRNRSHAVAYALRAGLI